MKSLYSLLSVCVLAAAVPAHADTLTFTLNTNGCTSGCAVTTAGDVTLTQQGANKVLVTVSLNSADYTFHHGGSHDSFAFNLSGDPALSLASNFSNASTGITFVNAPGKEAGVAGNQNFDYALEVTSTGVSSLSFDLTATGLTIYSFVKTGTGGSYFAADVSGQNAAGAGTGSFADGGSDPTFTPSIAATPEPSALLMMATGLASAAGMFRRRIKNA